MAKGATFKVEGLMEVDAALADLPRATGKNVLRRVAKAGLAPIAEEMKRLAPVDYGDLRDSINVTTKNPKGNRKESSIEAHAGPGRLPQAHLREFGGDHHPAQPYVRPAWDQGKDALLNGIKDSLWNEIENATKRLARKAARLAAKG